MIEESLGRPCEAVLLAREEHSDYILEELEITLTPPLRSKATVLIPRNGVARHPAIVALHSMGGDRTFGRGKLLFRLGEPAYYADYRQEYYGGRSLQVELAKAGFLSIAIDAFGFGDRVWNPGGASDVLNGDEAYSKEEEREQFSRKVAIERESLAMRMLTSVGLSIAALTATDDLRAVDYLCSRNDVHPEQIGAIGFSFGAFRSQYLAALDPRVRAAVSVCWTSTMRGIVNHNILGAMGNFALPPRLYQKLDLVDIASVIAPKPFLAISGLNDPMLQPFGIAEAHLHLRKVWQAAGAAGNLGSLVEESGHSFSCRTQKQAISFLQQHLQ